MADLPDFQRDDGVRPQDFDGDRHRAETHFTALGFGVAAPPVDDTIADDIEAHWILPGHEIVLGGLADARIFGDEVMPVADEPPPSDILRVGGDKSADSVGMAAARDYLLEGRVEVDRPPPVAAHPVDLAADTDILQFDDLPLDVGPII